MQTLEEALAKIEQLEKTFNEEREALKRKNEELIGEKRKVQERNRELEDSDATKKMAEMEARIEELKKGGNTEELQATYQKQLADLQAAKDEAIEAERQARKEAESRANNMIAERDLSNAIAKANIASPLVEAFTALVKSKGLEVNTAGDAPYAMIEGRKVSDYVSDFAKTDAGKAFVSAPGNGGGGGAEPNANGGSPTKKWDDMSLAEQTAWHKSDPEAAKSAMQKAA